MPRGRRGRVATVGVTGAAMGRGSPDTRILGKRGKAEEIKDDDQDFNVRSQATGPTVVQ